MEVYTVQFLKLGELDKISQRGTYLTVEDAYLSLAHHGLSYVKKQNGKKQMEIADISEKEVDEVRMNEEYREGLYLKFCDDNKVLDVYEKYKKRVPGMLYGESFEVLCERVGMFVVNSFNYEQMQNNGVSDELVKTMLPDVLEKQDPKINYALFDIMKNHLKLLNENDSIYEDMVKELVNMLTIDNNKELMEETFEKLRKDLGIVLNECGCNEVRKEVKRAPINDLVGLPFMEELAQRVNSLEKNFGLKPIY